MDDRPCSLAPFLPSPFARRRPHCYTFFTCDRSLHELRHCGIGDFLMPIIRHKLMTALWWKRSGMAS